MESELIQYYIVNTDLGMSTGKVAAQVAHASMLIALRDRHDRSFKEWMGDIMKKIILGGTEKELKRLLDKDPRFIPIIDKGLTEIPPDSLTVIGFPVMTRAEARKYTKGLKLF